MNKDSGKYLFILGCERSGSTWFSNVFESHPDVELFMEPFADYANIFPGFPSRNLYVDHGETQLADSTISRVRALQKIKYPLFFKRGQSNSLRMADRFIYLNLKWLGNMARFRLPQRIEQYELLNLNSLARPAWDIARKSPETKLYVIKELRLNLKVGLIKQLIPNAQILIVIRHPGAQIESIVRLMEQGKLGELRRAMLTFAEHVRESSSLSVYLPLFEDWEKKPELEKLLVWWLVNYDVLIKDCKRLSMDCTVVHHEDVSAHPVEQFNKLFNHCELDFSDPVRRYVLSSSSVEGHKVSSAIDTRRNSADSSMKAISNVRSEFSKVIEKMLCAGEFSSEMKRYCN